MAAFKMKIAGREITFQSEEDAARLLAALERVDEAPERNGRAGRVANATAQTRGFDPMRGTLGFLNELSEHGKDGVRSPAVAQTLRCDPRGIGRRLLDVDAVLKTLGFKREAVYDNSKRLAEGGRVYLPGPEIAAAVEAVKRKAGSR